MGCICSCCKKCKKHSPNEHRIEVPDKADINNTNNDIINDKSNNNQLKASIRPSDPFKNKYISPDSIIIQFTTNLNWDNYFTPEELEYYELLYHNEKYHQNDKQFITHARFKKGEWIGEGSFGKVYQSFNEDNGNIVAIKELDLTRLSKRTNNASLSVKTEIELLSKLDHKNIINYFGVYEKSTKLNIILEYCIGGSLNKMWTIYKTFNETIIRKYTMQILEGIEYLHCHNIIHRDIKCANIWVDRDGICKLSDFGGAKIIKDDFDLTKKSFEGTPNWMAPEMVKSSEISRFSDIWSIGCTVLEMWTGHPPWGNKSAVDVLNIIYKTKVPPPIPKKASPVLRNFLEQCLKINPNERFNIFKLRRHPFITGDISEFIITENDDYSDKNMIHSYEINNKIYSPLDNHFNFDGMSCTSGRNVLSINRYGTNNNPFGNVESSDKEDETDNNNKKYGKDNTIKWSNQASFPKVRNRKKKRESVKSLEENIMQHNNNQLATGLDYKSNCEYDLS